MYRLISYPGPATIARTQVTTGACFPNLQAAWSGRAGYGDGLFPSRSSFYRDCMTVLIRDPRFLRHQTGHHPECPARLAAIMERLERAGLRARTREITFLPLPADAVARIHRPEVIARAQTVAAAGGGLLDADTVVCPESVDVAFAAAGACVAAVDAVMNGPERNGLCLVRPPGHHATLARSMGFCLFNNVALAADHARSAFGVNRVLIVDWDVHHGNGTQDIFFADSSVMFFSIHRFGHGFYPGTGAADETGTGPGLGFTINAPVRYGTPRPQYHAHFLSALEKAADRMRPELVLLSAGFDAHRRDPIGSLGLEAEDFATLTRLMLQVADTHAQGRLVSCLEGGYDLTALAESVQAHLEELLASRAA
jgi:acetoin utilization deacetylase AcuC-like enzyme